MKFDFVEVFTRAAYIQSVWTLACLRPAKVQKDLPVFIEENA